MDATSLYPLVFYIVLTVLLVAGLTLVSSLLGQRHRPGRAADAPFESGIVTIGDARLRLPIKFYLIAMFFVIFDLEAAYLYAWSIALRNAGWPGFVEALVFVLILLAALAYLWRVGALDWGGKTDKHVRG